MFDEARYRATKRSAGRDETRAASRRPVPLPLVATRAGEETAMAIFVNRDIAQFKTRVKLLKINEKRFSDRDREAVLLSPFFRLRSRPNLPPRPLVSSLPLPALLDTGVEEEIESILAESVTSLKISRYTFARFSQHSEWKIAAATCLRQGRRWRRDTRTAESGYAAQPAEASWAFLLRRSRVRGRD
jgi:hypothetical protein